MPDRLIRSLTLAACLATPIATVADDATPPMPRPDAPTNRTSDPLAAAAMLMQDLEGFDVLVSTVVRDADGRRLAPPSRGRIAFDRGADRLRFVAETWGGSGSCRMTCDGTTITVADPVSRTFESRPISDHPAAWLDDSELTARLGPAAIHLLGLVLDDGLSAFRATGPARVVDLGPTRASLVPCRPARNDDSSGEIRLAFAADGPALPLAVAILLPSGGAVELEFHDWTLGRPAEDAMFMTPPADWRRVASLPTPAHLDPTTATAMAGAESVTED